VDCLYFYVLHPCPIYFSTTFYVYMQSNDVRSLNSCRICDLTAGFFCSLSCSRTTCILYLQRTCTVYLFLLLITSLPVRTDDALLCELQTYSNELRSIPCGQLAFWSISLTYYYYHYCRHYFWPTSTKPPAWKLD